MKETINNTELRMQKSIDALNHEYASIRAGRANASILDKIKVEYYGTPTPINQLGNISVPEAKTLLIQPWDASVLKEIEKEIQKSDIGINPTNDGKVIRLNFPPLTEERRKALVKDVSKIAENAKVSIRNIRRDGIDKIKALKKDNQITEDDVKEAEEKIQKITDKYIKNVDEIAKEKEKEILTV
ncbi:MAG: ribosome recycling factor [Clostridia bacterium]|nr:ribosome recycling factor [Oscillospiraceae bacterium]MBR4892705.1 ribosome recycling factor [Clostridia bacterium]